MFAWKLRRKLQHESDRARQRLAAQQQQVYQHAHPLGLLAAQQQNLWRPRPQWRDLLAEDILAVGWEVHCHD